MRFRHLTASEPCPTDRDLEAMKEGPALAFGARHQCKSGGRGSLGIKLDDEVMVEVVVDVREELEAGNRGLGLSRRIERRMLHAEMDRRQVALMRARALSARQLAMMSDLGLAVR